MAEGAAADKRAGWPEDVRAILLGTPRRREEIASFIFGSFKPPPPRPLSHAPPRFEKSSNPGLYWPAVFGWSRRNAASHRRAARGGASGPKPARCRRRHRR